MTPEELITHARTMVKEKVPFLHQGRSRHGLDCIGMPIVVLQELGILPKVFYRMNYGRLPRFELLEKVKEQCTALPQGTPGALVLIRWPQDQTPSHVAICTGLTLIHCYQQVGRVVEHGYRGQWVDRTHSTWTLPGVEYP